MRLAELGGNEARLPFRDLVEKVSQELIDAELTETIRAVPLERARENESSYRSEELGVVDSGGDVELRIPKGEVGIASPVVARTGTSGGLALWAVIMRL